MRWSRALVAALFLLAVAACSSPPASGPDDGDNGDGGGASTAPASQGGGDDGDGDDGDGGASGDVEDVYNALIPPNSTEILVTTAEGTKFGSYTSSDSLDSLISHYESAITDTGMVIITTTNAQGGRAWTFAEDESGSFGGSVSVFPQGDIVQVSVTVSE